MRSPVLVECSAGFLCAGIGPVLGIGLKFGYQYLEGKYGIGTAPICRNCLSIKALNWIFFNSLSNYQAAQQLLITHDGLYLCVQMFKGELNHTTTCNKCKDRNDSRSFFWILPLVVEDLHRQTYSVVLCFPLPRIKGSAFIKKYISKEHAGWLFVLRLQEKGLKAFFKEEKVCGDNKMYCNCCKKKRDAYLVSFPFYSLHQMMTVDSLMWWIWGFIA